ncbi:YueI family protein [Halobacillus sp. Nhm2S1]|uniref:YueI family protein n=1 Tax=Halobacillus sp. Nhm2S1 TaxID=2866716 RepID=UPI001C72D39C|nr:YueI family protein [Halobacillus sp. Nhm2S1]MBX0359650.1 YueI family protein [Halobacillus sp. Nhm2S1]
MKKPDMEDYLQEGIYGSRQTKPGERKQYLGTLRERVLIALTKGQVMGEQGQEELEELMKSYQDAKLLLNGEVSYRFLSPYMDLAERHNIHHSTVSNQETQSEFGAVLTLDYAIEKERIRVKAQEEVGESSDANGWTNFFKSLFKPSK